MSHRLLLRAWSDEPPTPDPRRSRRLQVRVVSAMLSRERDMMDEIITSPSPSFSVVSEVLTHARECRRRGPTRNPFASACTRVSASRAGRVGQPALSAVWCRAMAHPRPDIPSERAKRDVRCPNPPTTTRPTQLAHPAKLPLPAILAGVSACVQAIHDARVAFCLWLGVLAPLMARRLRCVDAANDAEGAVGYWAGRTLLQRAALP